MIRSELDAAGVHDPALRDAYERCRVLNAEHGRTFFLATRLLAPEQRPAVHALYGFARSADDILDDFDPTLSASERAERLQRLATQLFNQLVQKQDCGDDPALRAVVHTARRYGIPWEMFDDFLTSMRMDLTVTDYPDRTALERYMHGSAEVIGLQMLPVLGTVGSRDEAAPYAAALGKAFQLTNFLRDVDEDLRRGRVYLPADELAAHRVDRDMLLWCQTNRRTDVRVRRALAEQHAVTRRVYRFARKGIQLLDPRSQPCVGAAFTLYSEILDRIENMDYAIFSRRATVGTGRRLQVAGSRIAPRLARAVEAARYEDLAVTSLMAETSSFMAFIQPQILLCGASPDAARRASPALKGKLPVGNDNFRRPAAEVTIPPAAEAAGPLGTH